VLAYFKDGNETTVINLLDGWAEMTSSVNTLNIWPCVHTASPFSPPKTKNQAATTMETPFPFVPYRLFGGEEGEDNNPDDQTLFFWILAM